MRSPQVEAMLTQHGIEFTYKEQLEVSSILARDHHQARFQTSEDQIMAIGVSMESGYPIPAIIVQTAPGGRFTLLDGYHRRGAATLLGKEHLDAYVVRSMTPAQADAVMAEANSRHGLPPSPAERLFAAVRLVDDGYSQVQAAEMVGVTRAILSKRMADETARRRLVKLGKERETANLAQNSRVRLTAIRDDLVLREAVDVIAQTGMTTLAVNEMVSAVNRMSTREDQMAVLATFQTRYRGEIRTTAGGKVKFKWLARLSGVLTRLGNIDPTKVEYHALSSEHRRKLRAQVVSAQHMLAKVQEQL